MQDFALNILKISRRHAPKPPRKFGLLFCHQQGSRHLEAKVNFLFHFPVGK